MSLAVFVAILSVSLGWISGNPLSQSTNGEWVMVSGEVDGEAVSGATLTLDDSLAGVWDSEISPIKGELLCNTVNGESWDELFSTMAGCIENGRGPEPMEPPDPPGRWPESAMFQALRNGPSFEGSQLVFEIEGVRLVYERAD